jgi:VPDSG-CTERM motif
LCISCRVSLPVARFARVSVLAGLFAVVPFLGTAMAGPITLSTGEFLIGTGSLNQGFYQSTGAHTNGQTTTTSTATADTQRSFFIFNLADPDLDGLIIDSAVLRIFNPGLGGASVEFFDVSTLAVNLKGNTLNATGVGIFNDLGGGTLYGGGATGNVNVSGGYVSFDLLAAATNAMNLTDGYFSIGASLRFAGTAFGPATVAQPAQLVLQTHAVPVPDAGATLSLFGLAGAALAVLRRRL